ncbi:MAG: hypothetical protein ACC618_00060 [Patescibacteria group bacterium]
MPTPEYLKSQEHEVRADEFVNLIATNIAPEYPDLDIVAYNMQNADMDLYDSSLKEGPPFTSTMLDDDQVMSWVRHWSDYSERQAVDRVDVPVRFKSETSSIDRRKIKGEIRKAKRETKQLARKLGAKKLGSNGISEKEDPYTISSTDFYTFRRK